MQVLYVLFGGALGLVAALFGGSILVGMIAGAIIAWLLGQQRRLEQRIEQLVATAAGATGQPAAPPANKAPPANSVPPASKAPPAAGPPPATSPEPQPLPLHSRPQTAAAARPEAGIRQRAAAHTPFDRFVAASRDWITTGNVPVKVGVIVSFVGVSFLLKYAVERGLFSLPLEFRLLGVAMAGFTCLAIGWRLRRRMRVYALSLQGGGIGILFLTIFAALRVWQLLPAPLAFALLLALAAATGALAVLQDARTLAVLGVVGGFLAPLLTSTGQGSHVALFSYYLVLNGVILGIAWRRAWRELNLIGFWFTFAIAGLWGYGYFEPALFASTEPFLVLYFLFYQAIALLYALRQPPERLGVVDGTLVFGTPVLAFALQSQLVRGSSYGLAISAAALALFYAAVATSLMRRKGPALRLFTEAFTALAVVFTTLALPLALDARWTAAAWALEGAALIWTGTRQSRRLPTLAGVALLLLSGAAFGLSGWQAGSGPPVLNGNVLGGALIALSALFGARQLSRSGASLGAQQRAAATLSFTWGALWWGGTAWLELQERLAAPHHLAAFAAFAAVSATAALWLGRRLAWDLLRQATIALLPLFTLLALAQWHQQGHWLLGAGWLAWPALAAAQGLALRDLDERGSPQAPAWHLATLLLITILLAAEAHWWTALVASRDWAAAAANATVGLVALALWRWRHQPGWPVPRHPADYLWASLFLVALQWASLLALSALLPGDPAPLPYLPVINPFDLAGLCAVLTAALGLRVARIETGDGAAPTAAAVAAALRSLLAPALLALTTLALLRGIHHVAAVPWHVAALFDSVIVQTALSIWWGLAGVAAMVAGARRQARAPWLAGAGLMAVVVLKLFLIDLGNSATLARIISFIGTGLLLLIVGYLAPAPPKQRGTVRDLTPEPPPHDI